MNKKNQQAKKTNFRICIPGAKYKDKDGKDKTKWNNVGAAFPNPDGSISCVIDENISVSSQFVLFPA